jgi:endogenous inhibitor of DNA gyrase (YacG/DUF329 family)
MFLLDSGAGIAMLFATVLIFGIWIGFAFGMGKVTEGKGHGFAIGFVLTLIFPLIGLIVSLCLGNRQHELGMIYGRANRPRQQIMPAPQPLPQIACSICTTPVTRDNAFCPQCGTPIAWDQMPAQAPTQAEQHPAQMPRPRRRNRMR